MSGKKIKKNISKTRAVGELERVRAIPFEWRWDNGGEGEKVLQRFFLFSLGDIYERDPVRSTHPLVIHSLSLRRKQKKVIDDDALIEASKRERVFFSPFGRRRRSGRLYTLCWQTFFWWRLLLVCCRTLGASFPLNEKHITSQHCSYRKRNRNVRG